MFKYLILLFLISLSFAASSSSFDIDKIHLGGAGDTGDSSSYASRFTLTYEQPSNHDSQSTSFNLNLGWFNRLRLQIATASTSFTIFEFPYLWRVNRDSRRTRILPGLNNPMASR